MSTQIHGSLAADTSPAPVNEPTPTPGAVRVVSLFAVPLLLIAFSLYLIFNMLQMDVPDSVDFPGPRFFPAIIAIGMLVLALVDIVAGLRTFRSPEDSEDDAVETTYNVKGLLWSVGGFIVFTYTLTFLGWIFAAALLFWCVAIGFGAKRKIHAAVVGLTLSSLTYIAFSMGLGLPLPAGFLGGLL